ncbi:RagB/SusD family nutrient uptake outer membrane protein [Chitinophaga silvatica]|uniref:RagB/SusD family nutrient uptake outer membrane protein n=1 Tax=Chitinophaga silvatica TaxID=2282649 RepID=A0A3E1Y8N6_9BACT|nr:RagB/SusD family nutrient uptake outer membrane protein [Chitinophaga silvatica]RFS21772.1 RagB/SusD family nutrient uptake outer membrane protein [Chitinophaga silvatica]
MKKTIILILTAIGTLSLPSCKKWLDVNPHAQLGATDLLSTSEGYRSALAGVYYNLSQNSLYGVELEFGMIDALAQYWNITAPTHNLYEASKFNYKNAAVKTKINEVWKQLYTAIANTNFILASLESTNAAKITQYNLIKGEALGLRAFAHMELLKMFGPVTKIDGFDKPAIAYRKQFDHAALKFNTSREVLNFIEEDLQAAKTLLANDPIKTLTRSGNGNTDALNYDGILDRRGSRMNYYAVLGLLARNSQLKGDNDAAYKYATELIDEVKVNQAIRFTAANEISTPSIEAFRDIKYTSEMIFSLYIVNHYQTAGPYMGYADYTYNSNNVLLVDYNRMKNFVYGTAEDYRLKYWFPSAGTPLFLKYIAAQEVSGLGVGYYPEVCLLRLPEIYYIAAESKIGKDNQRALDLLNEVRAARGLKTPLTLTDYGSDDAVLDALISEERKEFLGEGKLFLLYKRLYKDIIIDNNSRITASNTIFVFPIPDEEYEFSPNIK